MAKALFQRIFEVLRDSVRIWWLAPLVPMIAVIPEFAQHVAEIKLGMFDSIEAAKAIGNGPTRWAFGYVKIAGLLVAIFATVRFWATRIKGDPWWSLKDIAWKVLGIGLLANIVVSPFELLLEPATAKLPNMVAKTIEWTYSIAVFPLLVLLVAGLVGDQKATLRSVYRTGWGATARMVIFVAIIFLPLSWLHTLNHRWAMGAQPAEIWTLMVLDSLVVGLMATGIGTAIHHAYYRLNFQTN